MLGAFYITVKGSNFLNNVIGFPRSIRIVEIHSFFFCFLLFCIALNAQAQKEGNIWYFGHHAGLDFSDGSPKVLSDGALFTEEGVATICDKSGKLLFYTDGITIWNREHQEMPNGTGLLGNKGSTQSAIIVPAVDNISGYYVFTVELGGDPNGLNYSFVDMNLDGGLGDLVNKNVQLQTPVCEKITAVKHCNGKDIWVITHGWNDDAWYAYLVTSSGVGILPVVTHTGRLVTGHFDGTLGYLKASPNGKRLAAAHFGLNGLDLLDFDNSTGIVSNPLVLTTGTHYYDGAYGVEFSPNSKVLYANNWYYDQATFIVMNILVQYDISLSTDSDIIKSKKELFKLDVLWQYMGLPAIGTRWQNLYGKYGISIFFVSYKSPRCSRCQLWFCRKSIVNNSNRWYCSQVWATHVYTKFLEAPF